MPLPAELPYRAPVPASCVCHCAQGCTGCRAARAAQVQRCEAGGERGRVCCSAPTAAASRACPQPWHHVYRRRKGIFRCMCCSPPTLSAFICSRSHACPIPATSPSYHTGFTYELCAGLIDKVGVRSGVGAAGVCVHCGMLHISCLEEPFLRSPCHGMPRPLTHDFFI